MPYYKKKIASNNMSHSILYKESRSEHKHKKSLNHDKLFEPSIDMMVNDFDDERTLEEEEELAAVEAQDPKAELSNLEKEQEMSIEELMALYGYGSQDNSDRESLSQEKVKKSESKFLAQENSSRLLRLSRVRSDDYDDFEYLDEDDRKKTIMVGSDFQATIPEGLCSYDDALPYENKDTKIWDPNPLSEEKTEEYLTKIAKSTHDTSSIPLGTHLKDDEQSLYLLLQCGYNIEEALRRRRINSVPSDESTFWSEEECRNFESGLRSYGKDFFLIQQNKVRTRSVGELVQFYYLWKKTERHDVFASKSRLEKKKYSLHPGVTDFMDRFLEEDDLSRDRSSSPSFPTNVIPEKKVNSSTRYVTPADKASQ